ncbi:hypothetical protein WJX74_010779 [Apatococcus lobatus]|uniref:Uncharacterized protein n=1 Tax=Apatococcus lobatus TaxID=904363 RepID=A0AAW1S3S9_9CHLO
MLMTGSTLPPDPGQPAVLMERVPVASSILMAASMLPWLPMDAMPAPWQQQQAQLMIFRAHELKPRLRAELHQHLHSGAYPEPPRLLGDLNASEEAAISNGLEQLLNICVIPSAHPSIAKKIAAYESEHTPACLELKQKAHKPIEKTLSACQHRRSAAGQLTLELWHAAQYLMNWKLPGNEFLRSDLASVVAFAKHASVSASGNSKASEVAHCYHWLVLHVQLP